MSDARKNKKPISFEQSQEIPSASPAHPPDTTRRGFSHVKRGGFLILAKSAAQKLPRG